MTIDLTTIIEAVIALIAALISYKLIPWLKAKTTSEQQKMLSIAVNTFVFAAEQIYGSGKGDEKKQYVIDKLAEQGYEVDDAVIEAEVKKAFNSITSSVTTTTDTTEVSTSEA